MSLRSFLARIEPEAIPFPFSRVYLAISSSKIFEDFYSAVASQVDEHMKAGRVLDVGSGPGRLPIMLAARNPRLYVVGLDLSGDMVKIASATAAKKGLHNVEFRQGSADTLPFGDREFDLVISTMSFHHWKKPDQALDDIYRVLREGGEAWIYDIPRNVDPEVFGQLKKKYGFFRAWALRLHAYIEPFYTETEVLKVAKESRFKRWELKHTSLAYRLMLYK
ncbi:class I SAM-dependent methyltransferase [Methanocella arvoryzae]|uniref:Methyltransferase (UbiE/COQ5 family) n=1 Tax=Methanocella arvoryzae (strain DSM 22066 / NBRC 105507 / MRE50) TaxID=351160 RepID=Q0W8Y1_METAR|nr:class I SAM-dependent methyltransferase [Methanocella arvoryzae]CAJ35145.2 putative methyltransferase (UbiE/COQ5 family) [Methanocella arvoryzae MRE50]